MYSVEERVFYIERMWAEGLRPTTASELWGRPGRVCLAEWEKQALAGELPAKRMPVKGDASGHRKHEKYDEETKSEALRLVSSGKSVGQASRILGLPKGTVGTWVRAARNSANMSSGKTREKGAPARGGRKDVAESEESRLKKELDEANKRIEALVAVLADPKVDGLARLSNRQKVELGERLRLEFGLRLREVLSLLSMSKSTYEYNRKRLGEPERGDDSDIEDAVVDTFEVEGGGARGYRFVCAELRRHGVVASEKRVRRVMRRHGLVPRALKASKRWSSYEGEVDDGAPNLLIGKHGRHVFRTRFPGALWLTDVSEFSVPAGKAYLSPIIDCFDGAVVSWSVSRHPDGQLTDSMLEAAASQLPAEGTGPVLHSDRGVHYRRDPWRDACDEAGITRSMSRKSTSPDNARMEGFFGTMKNEMFYGRDWRLASVAELVAEIDRYMEGYNDTRLKRFFEGKSGPRGGKKGREVYNTINERRARLGFEPAKALRATPQNADC